MRSQNLRVQQQLCLAFFSSLAFLMYFTFFIFIFSEPVSKGNSNTIYLYECVMYTGKSPMKFCTFSGFMGRFR